MTLTKAFTIPEAASRVPRLRAGCDVRALPITPREAFLLSHIDGSTSEVELSELTGGESGLGPQLGRQARQPRRRGRRTTGFRSARVEQHTTAVRCRRIRLARVSQTQFKSVAHEPRESEEAVDLDREKRLRILEAHEDLKRKDYYGLLGIPETAEKKDIKRAYYALAPDYHPDKFYGKNLGSFKAKMEAIFAHVTFAYETLSSAERRRRVRRVPRDPKADAIDRRVTEKPRRPPAPSRTCERRASAHLRWPLPRGPRGHPRPPALSAHLRSLADYPTTIGPVARPSRAS